MGFLKKDLFSDLITIYEKLNKIFDDSLARSRKELKEGEEVSSWNPPVDIYESDDYFFITAELAGVEKKDIMIRVNENTLILQGVRKLDNPTEKGINYHRLETNFGSFSRTFTLSEIVDKDNIVANFNNGILEIKLPKVRVSKSIKIEIE